MRNEYAIDPVAKPRMTRRDKIPKFQSHSVRRYWSFKTHCGLAKVRLPHSGAHVTFILPMPDSWSARKKALLDGTPHQQTPDLDNLIKGLGDAVYENDSGIWNIEATKLWGYEGKIIIRSD